MRVQQWQYHPFHLTEISLWPVIMSFVLFSLTSSAALYFHHFEGAFYVFVVSFILTIITMLLWTNDVSNESDLVGDHTSYVAKGLTLGFAFFIVTEVLFFFAVFWTYLHSSLNPAIELGAIWPPADLEPINAYELPLLNTILLLSSGATLTYSHHKLIQGDRIGSINGLIATIVLGVIFMTCQFIEYKTASFTIVDSIYGTCFYFTTGLHGFHVIIGATLLTVCLRRLLNYRFTTQHHVGYESSILYWHLVDVVWLIVLSILYFWGS